jgi:tetratricopeptide (TPR) repeat protein
VRLEFLDNLLINLPPTRKRPNQKDFTQRRKDAKHTYGFSLQNLCAFVPPLRDGSFCFFFVCFAASQLFADEAANLFQQGNQHYQAGEYQKAVEAYEGIPRLGRENWQVYYNLGNAYYKQGRSGKAILNYERALRSYPDNEDIRFNLDLANLQIADRIPVPPRSVVLVWLQNALRFISLDGSAALALIFWLALFAGLILSLMSRRSKGQQWGRMLAWSAAVLFALFGCLFVYEYYDHQTSFGIVMAPRAIVRSSPAESATEVFILHEGAKARLETKTGDWMRIRLADGKVGWLLAAEVEKI